MNCPDLRIWAKAHRYRFRLEESYQAERAEHRGDGRWYIEVLCRYGLIYPCGETTLLAYATRGVKRHLANIGLKRHQTDGDAEVFKFPVERLDEVAAILKPRRKRTVVLTPEQIEARRETLRRAREALKTLSPDRARTLITHDQGTIDTGARGEAQS
jgi:hypothetical protein